MRKLLIPLVLALIGCASIGCASQKWYYNKNVKPNEQQMFYDQDLNYCQGVAAGTIPMPNIDFAQSQGYRTFGTAQIYSHSSGYADVRYQSETYPTGGNSVLMALQVSQALDASTMRDKFAESCMFRLGWREIPCKTCVPSDQPKRNIGTTVLQLEQRYYSQPKNKAFARGTNNVAGAAWGAASEEEAKIMAIRFCAESGGVQCKITSVNNIPQ